MSPKAVVAIAILASVLSALGGFSARSFVARADQGMSANTSCSSTTPCVTDSNSSSGVGLKSISVSGNGLIGTTNALGRNSTSGRSALLGEDQQTSSGDGLFNFGVMGTSKNGTGVLGSGGSAGVSGTTTAASGVGVLATSTNLSGLMFKGIGVGGLSVFSVTPYGMATFGSPTQGQVPAGGVLVNSFCGISTPMFEGSNQEGASFVVDSCGDTIVGGFLTLNNVLQANDTMTSESPASSGTNYTAIDASGVTWLYQGYSDSAGKFTIEMGDSGSIYARIFITTGSVKMAQPTANGSRVDTYAQQDAQPTIEDVGEAQLIGGTANVPLDQRFAAVTGTPLRHWG